MAEANRSLGRTDVSVEDIRAGIDLERAADSLEYWDVEGSLEKIESFIDCFPQLLEWLENNGRRYPWRETRDPWRVYITEILLQRTRADAVASIYDNFFKKYPNPEALKMASETEVYQEIQSLGFGNQRAKTLAEVGEFLTDEHGGDVPCSIEALQEPWRTGPYVARATVLFAFEQPVALVDSNFARILSRVFNIDLPQQPHKSDEFYQLLESLVHSEYDIARAINFALLDLGAIICTPQSPNCSACPLLPGCEYGRSRIAGKD